MNHKKVEIERKEKEKKRVKERREREIERKGTKEGENEMPGSIRQ